MSYRFLLFVVLGFYSCFGLAQTSKLVVLGIAQDAGFPQAGCDKSCCKQTVKQELVTSLAVLQDSTYVLIDATPDFKYQLKRVNQALSSERFKMPEGIFLTHAHIGHYTGLIHLGREVIGAKGQAVYVMPKMKSFLKSNGPWDQLVKLNNISLKDLHHLEPTPVMKGINLTPVLVPHRDEYSETVGFIIEGENKKALFIPDIDKWGKFGMNIDSLIKTVDYALLDGTFYSNNELPGRDMSEIPHPFITESMDVFGKIESKEKNKIYFIHFNHSNPAMWDEPVRNYIKSLGFNLAYEGLILDL